MQNYKIAFISSHIDTSLQFVWFQNELKNNNVNHIHIIINTLDTEPQLAIELKKLNIPTFVFDYTGTKSLFTLFFKVRTCLRKNKINLVHTTLPFGNLIGQLAAISIGIKARVTTCENASWAFDYNSKKQWLIDKFTFISSKKIISVANTANDFLINNWKVSPKKLVQINHALDVSSYENVSQSRINSIKHEYNFLEKDFIIGMISRTEFWKGHQYAVEAMHEVVKKYPSIKLLICGSVGFDHQKLLDLIEQYKLQNNVKFIGFVNDSVAFLKTIHVQLHIPINKYVENCGISIIEGMAAQTPQILTLSGYAFQSAKHLNNAYVVDYCNSKETAIAIEYVYNNYEKAILLAKQAYIDAKQQYTPEVKLNKHLEVYTSLLS